MQTITLPSNSRISIIPRELVFKQPAGTSRGTYHTRKVWYIIIKSQEDATHTGIGECAPLPGLSCDALPDYEYILARFCRDLEKTGYLEAEALRPYPSILFGMETAIRHYECGNYILWDTPFTCGEAGIPINGLIWMGDYEQMHQRIEEKIKAGFRCIKLKIGAIRFEEELELLKHIRKHYSAADIELRVDANGAFTPDDAPDKLRRLAELDLHSIEQPIPAGQWDEMKKLAAITPLPIALDEELIGINDPQAKRELLDIIRPQYIILKPSLHGGISGCNEWIELAEERNIGWWITSALESNIGLNAIAQWCATFDNPLPQGLGTGQLFETNELMPLSTYKDNLWFHRDLADFLSAWYDKSADITVQTSGSTGTPKQMTVRKDKMEQSARLTCSFLGLQKGDKALLCMPVDYIAGKMMVVRALTAELDLIIRKPDGHPLADIDEIPQFVAMTPMQVYNTLQVPEERKKLEHVLTVIIGGGSISKELEEELNTFPNEIHSTYGMTETLSHIALRGLSAPWASEYYSPFPSVKLSVSPEGTLIIDAPLVSDEIVYTNDIVELLPDGRFKIIGRKDNIINSGGIKVQAEEIESKLAPYIAAPFAIAAVPDEKFGELPVLLVTKDIDNEIILNALTRYEQPRYIWKVEQIPLTDTGKTDRSACKELSLEYYSKLI